MERPDGLGIIDFSYMDDESDDDSDDDIDSNTKPLHPAMNAEFALIVSDGAMTPPPDH